ncbi:hypothetical protein BH11MYX4_BH11MYX4_06420 [soil metagenome]
MTVYVFCGPTISASDARKYVEAEVLGPAAQGDLYRVSLERPDAIGLIDGYFDSVPAVGHKEILWALHRGIHVYGGASMGALRAAELADLGMVGVGTIYERLASGELEDDDEVAVAHGAASTGYRAGSEAMVNIRATLERALRDAILTADTAAALTRLAKRTFYAERSWPALFADAAAEGLAAADLRGLRDWLPANAIDQKRIDAIAMLERMAEHLRISRAPFSPSFDFEHTVAWESMRRRVDAQREQRTPAAEQELSEQDPAVEEVQVAGSFGANLEASLGRALAVEHARTTGRTIEGELLYTAIESFRGERGLTRDADFERWLEDNQVGDLEFFKEDAQARLVHMLYQRDALHMLPNHLRSTGEYRLLAQRAREKQRAVAHVDPSGTDNGASCDERELFHWYFVERLRRPQPTDLDGYARALGMRDAVALRRAVWRERVYVDALSKAKS